MKLFHGSETENLETLVPCSVDREGGQALYLTDNWAYSLFYLRDRKIDFVTCGVGKDGRVHYDEKFPDQLKILYQGRSGYIYETDTVAEATRVRGIWISRKNAVVTGCTFIPDVYQAILCEIQNGTIEFLSFGKLTPEQMELNKEGVKQLFLSGKTMTPEKNAFYRAYFPAAWEEAQNILAQRK